MARADDAHMQATYQSMIDISRDGFRFLASLNGGTLLVAILLAAREHAVQNPEALHTGVTALIVSMALTAMCFLGSWLTQYVLHNENCGRFRAGLHMCPVFLTVVVYFVAIISFVYGIYWSAQGLLPA